MPLKSHDSKAPDVRLAPQVRLAMNGDSGEIAGICEDEPTCMQTAISSSFAAAIRGSQKRSLLKTVGSPRGAGFSEKQNAVAPFSAQRSSSVAASAGSHMGTRTRGI